MKIYIYGIIDSKNRIDRSIKGLEGMSVYNMPYRDISAAISNLGEQVQNVTPDRAVIHEIVIERLMDKFTVLPIRFLTVFDRKRDVLSMLKSYYGDFRRNLGRLCNKVEFGIKVIWPVDEIKEQIVNAYAKDSHSVSTADDSPEKNFLERKFEMYEAGKAFEEKAEKYITEVDNFLSGFTVEKKLKKLRSEFLLLEASYLMEKEKQNEFREAFEKLRSTHSDFKYLFSGPWPPYNFIILEERSIRQNFSEEDMFNGATLGIELNVGK